MDLSTLPGSNQLLIETCRTREGMHLYAYPFEGRFVHEGLGFLWATRLTRVQRGTITVSVNDYGFELLAPRGYPMDQLLEDHLEELLDDAALERDLEQALNLSELCKRRFRGIAQVAGLLVQGFPGQNKSTGQLQISGSLLWDVFSKHEPNNLLLRQARDEVMQEQLELPRRDHFTTNTQWRHPALLAASRATCLSLLVERLNNRMTNPCRNESANDA